MVAPCGQLENTKLVDTGEKSCFFRAGKRMRESVQSPVDRDIAYNGCGADTDMVCEHYPNGNAERHHDRGKPHAQTYFSPTPMMQLDKGFYKSIHDIENTSLQKQIAKRADGRQFPAIEHG